MGHDLALVNGPAPAAAAPTSLAPGFRFHPTDEELVQYYLKRKACGKPFRFQAVSEIDVYKSEPWELAGQSGLKTRDMEWYFFSPIDRKYGNGSRLNRATGKGYWKATGKDRYVRHKGQTIGMKKTLVFHSGRAPDGKRTNWVMHEYRLAEEDSEKARTWSTSEVNKHKDAFVLCRIFEKSGLGPPNGDRYAPFVEEEWNDETIMVVPGEETGDEIFNGDDTQLEGNEFDQERHSIREPPLHHSELPNGSQSLPFVCKRERLEETVPISLINGKRPKHDDPNSSNGNGSEESITTTHELSGSTKTTNPSTSFSLLEFPLLESLEPKENHGNSSGVVTFDASNLEKSVPPGYLKFISNLENGILNISMERETLKIEVMRAQAMINILQSHIDLLIKENEELKRAAC